MAGFIRRFLTDPGLAELLAIEGVVIIDREPPGAVSGLTTGMVAVVGEFEDGAFETPFEVVSPTDLVNNFGEFGFVYDGVPHNNPCARSRKADGQLQPEYWNGNGFLALVNKRFNRLAVIRVDTTVGSVEFTRRASVLGNNKFEWDLEPGQVVTVDIGGGPVNATFNAAIAQKSSGAGTFPTGFTGGERMTIVVDEGTSQQVGPLEVTFLAGDTSQVAAINRINQTFGFTLAVNAGGNVTRLDGRVRGTSGNVRVVSQDAAVAAALGFDTTVANGTGNVANIDKVTFAEAKIVIEAAVANTTVERIPSGRIRISANSAPSIQVTVATTADDFGFPEGVTFTAAVGEDGFIPAGTRVRDGAGNEWVTAQTVAVSANLIGPYSVKVRPALDDGTEVGALGGAVNVIPFPIELAGFSVVNPAALSPALSEAQLDAAYLRAFDKTLSANAVTRDAYVIASARQSNAIRTALRNNALSASNDDGLRGRRACIRPPLNTPRAVARSATSAPGVGATRSDRVFYCYPGVSTFVPQIATRGLAGGPGFTADGIVDLGLDMFVAALLSRLPPEENPGQRTPFMNLILGVERGNADVQDLTIEDYKLFRAAGIAALRMDEGLAIIQSGVTSVDPTTQANLRNMARRNMADFIQDSLAVICKPFSKKLASRERRAQCFGQVKGFLEGLKSPGNPSAQRIEDYRVDARSGNTPESLGLGIFRMIVRVRTLSSMDVIVLETTIGENVTFNELVEAA